MRPCDPVLQRFDRALAEAYAFYDADEYDKSLDAADKLLCEANLPRYYRIKCCLPWSAAQAGSTATYPPYRKSRQ